MLYYNQYVRAESLEEAYDLYQKKNNLTVQLNQAERLIEAYEGFKKDAVDHLDQLFAQYFSEETVEKIKEME